MNGLIGLNASVISNTTNNTHQSDESVLFLPCAVSKPKVQMEKSNVPKRRISMNCWSHTNTGKIDPQSIV